MAQKKPFTLTNVKAQKLIELLMVLVLVSSCSAIQPKVSELSTPFKYRSISFNDSRPPERSKDILIDMNRDLVKLAAEKGFNDVTIQTENWTMPKLEALRKWADETGNFKFIKDQGMTLSVWVHELNEMPKDIGKPTLDNERLWTELRQRYRYVCTELLPEVDYFILTVVESQLWVTGDAKVLTKLVTVINDECRKAGKKLIFRTFLWYVKEADVIMESLKNLPDDVIVMSKCVPQDWHLRGVDNPFIGKAGKRDQFVEFDIGGEYFKHDQVACAFTNILKRQLDYAEQHNCDGINVRIDRYGHTVWRQAQEANLWFLGLYASGQCKDEMEIWNRYATEVFGPKAAPAMVEALYPTGDVIAEALCVEQESYGLSRALVPKNHSKPFDVLHAPVKWDPSLKPIYDKIMIGDPEIIRRKQKAFDEHLAIANRSLALLDSVKDDLPEGAYPFFRWKLEENKFFLQMLCNAELAWLKDQRLRHTNDPQEQRELKEQVDQHVNTFRKLNDTETGKTIKVTWRGKTDLLRRGSFHNWLDWYDSFESYRSRSGDVNIAFGKPVTASSSQSNHLASCGNDGKPDTRWCAADDKSGNWWQVDLQKEYDLTGCKICWQFGDRLYQYKMEGSSDGKTWSMLLDQTEDGGVNQVEFQKIKADKIRYVRITITGLGGGNWASFYELEIFARTKTTPHSKTPQANAPDNSQRPALVFLIAGQSNAAGAASFSPELCYANNPEAAKKEPPMPGSTAKEIGLPFTPDAYPRSYIWSGEKKSFQRFAPGTELMQARNGEDYNRHGIELPMAWRLEKRFPNCDKYFIKFALGGTNLYEQWNPARKGSLYHRFIQYYHDGMADLNKRYDDIHLLALYWDQGESDRPKAQEYGENLRALFTAFRKDTGTPDLPIFVRKHLFQYGDEGFVPILNAQVEVTKEDPNAHLLDLDLGSNEKNNKAWAWTDRNGHLSSKAFLELTDRILNGALKRELDEIKVCTKGAVE